MDPEEKYKSLDAEIAKIQKSTRASLPAMVPLHDILRQKYSWYYRWHLNPWSKSIHYLVLLLWCAFMGVFVYLNYYQIPKESPVLAETGTTCVSQATGNWGTAGTWTSCNGTVPQSGDDVSITGGYTVTLNGAVDIGDGDLSIAGSNVLTTNNYALTVNDMTIAGTLNAGSSTITASGNWDSSAGSFSYSTSTVDLTGTGNLKTPGSMGSNYFYKLNAAASSKTTTLQSHIGISSVLTVGTGTFAMASYRTTLNGNGTPFVNAGATITGTTNFTYSPSSGTTTIAGGNYGSIGMVQIYPQGSNTTFNFGGDITMGSSTKIWLVASTSRTNTTINTQDYALTTAGIEVGLGSSYLGDMTFNFGDSTVDIGTTGIYPRTDTGTHYLNLETAAVTCAGPWKLVDGTGVISQDDGASSVNMDGGAQTITTNSQTFYDLTFSGSGNKTIAGNLDVDNDLALSGTAILKLDTNDPVVTVAGDLTIANGATWTKQDNSPVSTTTFDGTSILTDNNATKQDLGAVVLDGTSLTLGSSAKVSTMTNTSGTMNLGSSSYTLELAGTGATATVFSNSGTFTAGTSTVKYSAVNSGGNVNVATVPYSSLQFSGADTYDLTGNLTGANALTGDLTIDASVFVDTTASNYNISLAGDWSFSGTYFNPQSATVTMTGSGKSIGGSGSTSFYNLTINTAGTITCNSSPNITHALDITGTLSVASGQILAMPTASPALTINATSSLAGDGTFRYSPSSNGSLSLTNNGTIAIAEFDYQVSLPGANVTTTVPATTYGTDAVATNVTFRGIKFFGTATAIFNIGSGTMVIRGNLTIDSSSGGPSVSVDNSINDTNITLYGNWAPDNSGIVSYTKGTETIYFTKASGTQTLDGVTGAFNDITHSGAGTLQLSTNDLDVDGDLTNSAGTFDVNSLDVELAGNFTNNGTFSASAGTVTMTGASVSIGGSSATSFYNLTIDTAGTITVDTNPAVSGNLDITGALSVATSKTLTKLAPGTSLTINASSSLEGAGTIAFSSSNSTTDWVITNSGTINIANFNFSLITTSGNVSVTVPALTYGVSTATNMTLTAMKFAGSGTCTFNIGTPGTLAVKGNLTVSSSSGGPVTTLNNSGINTDINVGGNWTISGANAGYTKGTETVTLNGAGGTTQVISGSTTFHNLTATASSARTLQFTAGTTQTIAGTLTLTGSAGELITLSSTTTSAWTINPAAASVSYVNPSYSTNTGVDFCAAYSTNGGNNTGWSFSTGATCNDTITLDVDSALITFGNLLPGSILTDTTIATVSTNYSNGYTLAIKDNVSGTDSALLHTDTTTRIADYAGTIDTPTLWSGEGLGICVYIATDKEAKWGTGTTETDLNNKYAGVPETNATIHAKTGSPTTDDQTYVGYKVVVPNSQKTGDYSGPVTLTATGVLP